MTMSIKTIFILAAVTSCSSTVPIAYLHIPQMAKADELAGMYGFFPRRCWFQPPVDRNVICGTVKVPENRKIAGGRTIALPVVQLVPDSERYEPVVFLSGGPGQPSRIDTDDDIRDWWSFVDEQSWMRRRRLILFDQRGAGRAKPRLDCNVDFDQKIWSKITDRPDTTVDFTGEMQKQIISCRDRISSTGVNLLQYNTDNIAEDTNDIRKYLGIEKWSLYAISYGTTVGLALMEKYGDSISKAVLDSVLPRGINYISMDAVNLNNSIDALEKLCGIDTTCGDSDLSIGTMIERIADRLYLDPVLLHISGSGREIDTYTRVNGSDFLDIVFEMFYDVEAIRDIPRLVRRTYDHDYRHLVEEMAISSVGDSSDFADGMGYSVVCSENAATESFSSAGSKFTRWASEGEYQIACSHWLSAEHRRSVHLKSEPTVITTPTLMLSGQLDPVTPPSWAAELENRMTDSKHLIFKGLGHDILDSALCSSDIIQKFMRDVDYLDETECLNEMTNPGFTIIDGKL